MRSKSIFHYTDTLSILGLLCIFAGSIIIVIMSGANIYKRISQRDTTAYEIRTTSMYLTTKIRSAESADDVEVAEINGNNVLKISDRAENGSTFCTYVYFHDGYLKEAYISDNAVFTLETGEKLVQADDVNFEMSGNLVKATVQIRNSDPIDVFVYVNGEGEAA